jgi:uncharacterized protein (TIGR03437 family)
MDATQLFSRKIAFFLSFALLLVAAPWQAQAQPSLVVPSSVVVPSIGSSTSIQVTASDGSVVNFTAKVTYPGSTSPWLSLLNPGCSNTFSGTTPASITLVEGCSSNHLNYQPATITYTASGVSNSGVTTTATLGAAGGTITATGAPGGSNQLTLSTGTPSGTITLSTTSPTSVGFTFTMNPASWLTVSQTGGVPGQTSASQSAILTATANAGALGAGQYQTSVTVNYNGQTINVLVTFNSGGTGGGLTLSQTSIAWSYGSSTNNTGPTSVTATSPNGAGSYSAAITNINGNNWLALTLNNVTVSTPNTSTGLQPIGAPLQLQANGNQVSLGTGTYTATVQVTDSNLNSNNIFITLSVNGASTGLTISPNPIALSAGFGTSTTVSAVATLTSNVAGSNTVSAFASGTGLVPNVTVNPGTVSLGGTTQITVYASASGLSSGTYTGALSVTVGSVSQQFPVTFTVGSGTVGVGNSVAPTAMQFNYQTDGSSSSLSQPFMIGGNQTFTISVSQASSSWLSASNVTPPSGTAPVQGNITISPTSLAAGSYAGTVTVTFNDGTTQSIAVNLTVVSGTPLIYASPGSVVFNQLSGSPTYPVYLYSTNGSQLPVTVSTSTSWLTLISPPTTTQSAFTVQANLSNLPNGMNQGSISVGNGGSTLSVPVIAYITNGTGSGNGVLSFSPSTVGLSANVGTVTAATTSLAVTSANGNSIYFTAQAVQSNCTQTTWLSISPSAAYASGTSYPVTVSANPTSLPAGVCSGTIQFSAGGFTQSVPVTFTIGGGMTVSPTSLSFSYTGGGSTPAAQSVSVTTSSSTAIAFSAQVTSGNSWLTVSPTSGTTPATLSVSVNPAGLAAGSYTGTVAVTPSGGTATNVTVSLTVTTPTVSVSPTSLSFTYQAGSSTPSAQNVTVSGGGFSASATGGNWLSVSPTSSASAGTLSVSVNPSGLAAGTYNGTVTVSPASGLTGGGTVSVALTVTAPLPTVTTVVNAASFAGGAVSPGEVISIGGTAIGPTSPAFLMLDSTGKVATTIGGVSVTIGGYPAPLVYVSAGQINAIVPYEVAGQISPSVVVKYLGQTSNGFALLPTTAAPGIFTQSASGSGPGAILNQDYTVNGPSHPAARGTAVQIFMTGEGKTTPTAVTGLVNNVSNASQLPVPLLPVSASVAGQPAQVLFAAEAPGFVSGIMQVNVLIPATAPSGAQSIVVNVGTSPSQAGVTVNIQ